jgi:hypothetical protein
MYTLDSVTLHVTSLRALTTASTGSITANPNPFLADSEGLGQTTLAWTSSGTTAVEIHVDAPNGPKFAGGDPGSFSLATDHWVRNGMTFYLQDVSNGLPLTSANTLATVTVARLNLTPTGSVSANPNPFTPNPQGVGQTTLTWTSAGVNAIEIRANAPNGNRLARTGPGTFSTATGQWVRNGMTFYLQNVSNGLPLTSANTLATVTVRSTTPSGSITASPNPYTPGPQGLGHTTVSWTSYSTSAVEVHVNAPDGATFGATGPGTYSLATGEWVTNGMTFYLQNVSNGLPLTSANTLARVTVTAAP